MTAFISHSSSDKAFVKKLATHLQGANIPVWYDEWEVKPGDSIVDRIFEGLTSSDFLIVVLSPSSVESKWVKEELNFAYIKRIQARSIHIVPVLIEKCEIPDAILALHYADATESCDKAFAEIVEVVSPGQCTVEQLAGYLDSFLKLTSDIRLMNPNAKTAGSIDKLSKLLEDALTARSALELRLIGNPSLHMNFWEKILFLRDNGVDCGSSAWLALVDYKTKLVHARSGDLPVSIFAEMGTDTGYFAQSGLPRRPPLDQEAFDRAHNLSELITLALDELDSVMRLLCITQWPRRAAFLPPTA